MSEEEGKKSVFFILLEAEKSKIKLSERPHDSTWQNITRMSRARGAG